VRLRGGGGGEGGLDEVNGEEKGVLFHLGETAGSDLDGY
jgi:hypothetical protein